MLPRIFRLRKNRHFRQIINAGNRLATPAFNLFFIQATEVRVGVTVSSKLTGAVGRNKIRRQIHSLLKPLIDQGKLAGLQVVIIVRSGYLERSFQENGELLSRVLSQIEVSK